MTNTAKNMSEKEKAKRYDEALEEAKKWHKAFVAGQNYSATDIKVSYEWIFPELKKFEDEEIRGAILHFIFHTPTVPKGLISKEDMIGWLKKQGEQKPADKVEPITIRDFNSVFSREQVKEIDKRIEESQRLYNAKLRDAIQKVEDFPMTD